ncbi:MAG: hypothetical protein AUG51_22850 [Acidobacteria bacterium 13_1_20CM_3_53_8]|nr:MAG: hypothetical protein AUG51_22850 [Acidobacteria bacterium 13_1_20CM_3_53_8]
MIRDKLLSEEMAMTRGFRMRGTGEIARIEAFSDAVFAFAVTLLVVSLEVPRTFTELMGTMRGFFAFAISFFALFHVWVTQYKYFRRYGLNDNFTVWMNGFLIFVVLFYVYPLKFVWNLALNSIMGFDMKVHMADGTVQPPVTHEQIPAMMAIYGAGFAAVFLVFMLLYLHAWRKREKLSLNALELHDTREQVQEHALMVLIGLLSIATALLGGPRYGIWAGIIYWLIAPIQTLHGFIMGKRRRRLEAQYAAEAEPA